MNNFKKLLASAMALTMVTSVLPVNHTEVNAATNCSLDLYRQAQITAMADAIVKDIEAAGYTLSNVPYVGQDGRSFHVKDAEEVSVEWNNYNALAIGEIGEVEVEFTVEPGTTLKDLLNTEYSGWNAALLNSVKECSSYTGNVKKLAEMNDAINALGTNSTYSSLHDLFEGEKALADDIISPSEWRNGLEATYNTYKFYESYLGNVVIDVNATQANINDFKDDMARFDDAVADYQETYVGVYAKKYAEKLKEDFADVLDTDVRYPRTNLEDLKEAIADIEEDSTYILVQNEDEVVEIMDELNAIAEDMTTVNDLMNSRSDANRALRNVRAEVARLADAQNTVEANDDYVLDVINTFTTEDVENVVTYVEEFFNEFYTVDVRERSNGRYTAELVPTELERYLTDDDVKSIAGTEEAPSDIAIILTTFVDENARVADTYYDALIATEGTTKDDLMAIVDEVADIELKSSYTNVEVEQVYDAIDALDELLPDDGSNPYGLTAVERRELRATERHLERVELRIANAEITIEDVKDWWVYENGQWVFYQDGHTVSNRWVASNATDWYYAGANGVMLTNSWIARDSSLQVWYYVGADGKMVTNTVVDGCTIDANGEWHA